MSFRHKKRKIFTDFAFFFLTKDLFAELRFGKFGRSFVVDVARYNDKY